MQPARSDHALAELRRMLADAAWAPGTRLPTERVLSERFAVNRSTLRKALSRLEVEGAIVRRVGSGTFVAVVPEAPETLAASASPVELMDARVALEPVIAREAALRARAGDLQALAVCLAHSEAADAFSDFEHWDIAFHKALAEATQNPIFATMMEVLRRMRITAEWDRLKRAAFSPELRDRYRAEHRAVFGALEHRDPAGAASAMFQHMQSVRASVSGGRWEG